MNTLFAIPPTRRFALIVFILSALALGGCASTPGSTATAPRSASSTEIAFISAEARDAWRDLQGAQTPPPPPADWQNHALRRDEIAQWDETKAAAAEVAADLAHEFSVHFPTDPHTLAARKIERQMLGRAVDLGNNGLLDRLAGVEAVQLADPALSRDDRFEIMTDRLARQTAALEKAHDTEAAMTALEAGAREMQRTFPGSPEIYPFLMTVAARTGDPAKARRLAEEIVGAPANEDLQASARILLHWLARIGQPLPLRFNAIDGRAVNLDALHGKVVLVQFWASWCEYCTAELPIVKAVYDQNHARGFAIVGVSFDTNRDNLAKFLADRQIPWPQYCDGLGRKGAIAQQFEVFEIPTFWLVDKQGKLRAIDAREKLAEKVEQLLAE